MTSDLPEPLYIDPETGVPIFDEPETTPMTRWAPPCPLGYPQRPIAAFAYRDKGGGNLQLRVPMRRTEKRCSIVVQESWDLVVVRVILCCAGGVWDDGSEVFNIPARVWLDEPLDGRTVIDVESGLRLPTHESKWS